MPYKIDGLELREGDITGNPDMMINGTAGKLFDGSCNYSAVRFRLIEPVGKI